MFIYQVLWWIWNCPAEWPSSVCSLIRDKGNKWMFTVFSHSLGRFSVLKLPWSISAGDTVSFLSFCYLWCCLAHSFNVAFKEGGIIIYLDDRDIQFSLSHMNFICVEWMNFLKLIQVVWANTLWVEVNVWKNLHAGFREWSC